VVSIGPQIELGARTHIASLVNHASHGYDPADATGGFRLFENEAGDVGQRSESEHIDCTGRLVEQEFRQPCDGRLVFRLLCGIRQSDAADAVFPMQVQRLRSRPGQRRSRTCEDRNILPAGESQQPARVSSRRFNADVAGNRRHARNGKFSGGKGKQDSNGIVDAWIRIDDDQPGFCVRHDEVRNLAVSPCGRLSDTGRNLTIVTGAP
jgi:hypothetical protein